MVGVDVRGFRHAVSNQAIAHSLAKHGVAGEAGRGQHIITRADFARLPDIVRTGRYQTATQRPFGPKRVQIIAELDGYRYVYVGEIRAGKRRIDMITMWKR